MAVRASSSLALDASRGVLGVPRGAVHPDEVLATGAQQVVKVTLLSQLPAVLDQLLDYGINSLVVVQPLDHATPTPVPARVAC